MSSGRKYSAERIRECLAVLDAVASSGMTLQAYAQARGMECWQLRGWAAQAPRWRRGRRGAAGQVRRCGDAGGDACGRWPRAHCVRGRQQVRAGRVAGDGGGRVRAVAACLAGVRA